MAETPRYALDTSALIAYLTDEAGSDQVERILASAEARTAEVFASFMTYMEILYGVWRRLGEKAGKAAYLRLAVGGRLVHKDPEFRSLAPDFPVLELPLKTRATRKKR